MVKAYLRYDKDHSIGVILSRECNIELDRLGKCALTGAVDQVNVWNLRQGTIVKTLATAKGSERVTRLCVCLKTTAGSSLVAVGYADGAVRLWDYNEGTVLQTLQGHKSGVSALAFDGSGHALLSGANDTDIVVWDIPNEAGVARLRGHIDQVTSVLFWAGCQRDGDGTPSACFSGLGALARVISASKDRTIRIWSVEMQICIQTISEHQSEVWTLALNSSQTRLAAGSGDKFLRFWSLSAEQGSAVGEAQMEVGGASSSSSPGPAEFFGAVPRPNGQGAALELRYTTSLTGNEMLLCLGAGRTLEAFQCHDEAEAKRRHRRRQRRAKSKAAKKGDDEDEEVDKPADATPKAVHAADEVAELPPYKLPNKATSLAIAKGKASAGAEVVVVGLANNEMESLKFASELADGQCPLERTGAVDLPGHRTAVRALAVSHDDSLLMSASAESVKIWNVATGRCVRTMASGYGLTGIFVPGNEHVVLGTKEGHLELYDLRIAEMSQQVQAHTAAIYSIAETPDRKGFASCSADKHLRFFEYIFAGETASIEEVLEKAVELPDEALSLAFSSNGKWVAVGLLNHTVQLMFADTMKFYISLYGHRLPVMSVDFSSDSQMIATGSADKNVKLWSTQFGNCLRSLRAHEESVMQVKFLPGTHYLASAGRDRDLKLWDCDSYELITNLKGHVSHILSLALSQDASFIVTASADRQLRFWRRSQEQLFLSEERAKELEDKFEQEVEREDLDVGASADAVVALRASRRTVESVRTTERLMELLDEATAMEKGEDVVIPPNAHRNPCVRVVAHINTLNSNNIYEVLLALPFSHALRLLRFICRYLEVIVAPSGSQEAGTEASKAKVLGAVTTLETPCQAALIAAYVHHHELAATPSARGVILRLRHQMRLLLQSDKDCMGFSCAGVRHLQRSLKRASASNFAALASPSAAAAPDTATAPAKKRKRT
mmetsp:Transcript_82931/g.173632  ORF Transcript_82931/g.173632 Transcript_82931/m.173632 type:complete len:952 (-) Transcript_82931:243-3098(-)|eukprot:CAMPEP_0206429698 /NCGR_PEP_ID=MMETSP0324_2-20121206/6385_1 /ASSEMBLY_ACC=CAM_ASM_000836 /TAXON_ID=2866 /ORGANISM="Crypthecodinium cohnii, Strain Seligo" /LENGTH=951 /DNA_ID=CAMNT_0053895407 /DNA_START=46 /DNA_END=2901 /DNA_ORIENTATION=-